MTSDPTNPTHDETPLPESTEAVDPKAATFIRKGETLKKVISALQAGDPEAAQALLNKDDAAPATSTNPAADSDQSSESFVIVPKERPEPKVIDASSATQRTASALTGVPDEAPWTLQQFFSGSIDLDVELSKRFPAMPMLSLIKFRTLGSESGRRVATLSTQDGAASLVLDADIRTKVVQLSFTLGSMLTLKFQLAELTDTDRTYWLDLMQRDSGGLAFLWGQARWANDYIICISRKYFTNLYAFSTHNFDAAVRLTPTVTKQLMDWLQEVWQAEDDDEGEAPPPLLTW